MTVRPGISASVEAADHAGTATDNIIQCGSPVAQQLARLVATADRFVPFYQRAWREAGITASRLDLPHDLALLPVIQKTDFKRFDTEFRVDKRFLDLPLARETTSGSTGQPFEVRLDSGSIWRRRRRTWLGLWHSGYRPGQRMLWLQHSPPIRRGKTSLLRRLARLEYIDVDVDEQTLVSEYRTRRADILYGQLSALVLLALGQKDPAANRHRPSIIVGFGEQLNSTLRQIISSKLGVDVTDFYGTTEVGLVACRRPDERAFHLIRPDLLLEFLPADGTPGFERLIVTNLHGGAMPFIRYDTGDLVRRDHSRPGSPIVEMAGRTVDFLLLPDGSRIAPYRIDSVLDEIEGLDQYRIVQNASLDIDVNIHTHPGSGPEVLNNTAAAIAALCGSGCIVRVHHDPQPLLRSHNKLRIIQSHATRALLDSR